jgi:aspartokinase
MITTSEIKVTVVIDEGHVDQAVRSLHITFGLSQPQS